MGLAYGPAESSSAHFTLAFRFNWGAELNLPDLPEDTETDAPPVRFTLPPWLLMLPPPSKLAVSSKLLMLDWARERDRDRERECERERERADDLDAVRDRPLAEGVRDRLGLSPMSSSAPLCLSTPSACFLSSGVLGSAP